MKYTDIKEGDIVHLTNHKMETFICRIKSLSTQYSECFRVSCICPERRHFYGDGNIGKKGEDGGFREWRYATHDEIGHLEECEKLEYYVDCSETCKTENYEIF